MPEEAAGEACTQTTEPGLTAPAAAEAAQSAPPRILLIDLENCPSQAAKLLEQLSEFDRVVICYAQTGAKVPLDWLPALSRAVLDQRLQLVRMPSSGKNAADFGISFMAGTFAQQLPDASFVLLSNDTDLDHVVALLRSLGREAKRTGTQSAPAPAAPPATALAPAPTSSVAPSASALEASVQATFLEVIRTADEEPLPASRAIAPSPAKTPKTPLARFCTHMLTHNKCRPTKPVGLLNYLMGLTEQSMPAAQSLMADLQKKGIVVIEGTKLRYSEAKLAVWAD